MGQRRVANHILTGEEEWGEAHEERLRERQRTQERKERRRRWESDPIRATEWAGDKEGRPPTPPTPARVARTQTKSHQAG